MSRHSKVLAQTDKHTDRQTDTHTHTHKQYENITFPHTQVVKIQDYKWGVHLCVRSNTHNVHSSVIPSAALQLKCRLHPHEGI